MVLPDRLEEQLAEEMQDYEKEDDVAHITSFERVGERKGLKRGLEQGLERGLKQGLEQGLEQGIRESIGLLLEDRFGPLEMQWREKIEACKSPEQLKSVLRQATRIESPDQIVW